MGCSDVHSQWNPVRAGRLAVQRLAMGAFWADDADKKRRLVAADGAGAAISSDRLLAAGGSTARMSMVSPPGRTRQPGSLRRQTSLGDSRKVVRLAKILVQWNMLCKEVRVRTTVALEGVRQLIEGRHENPFELLGPHEVTEAGRRALAVRAFLPQSSQAWVVDPRPRRRGAAHAADSSGRPVRGDLPAAGKGRESRATCSASADEGGRKITMHDPYSFPHLLTDYDLHLLNEGRHWQCYNRLGAQLRTIDGVEGVNFAVWAPNATGVSVVGDFNNWDGRRHPMRKHIPSGFWELFVPGLGEGTLYKYQIRHRRRRRSRSAIPSPSAPRCRRGPPRR